MPRFGDAMETGAATLGGSGSGGDGDGGDGGGGSDGPGGDGGSGNDGAAATALSPRVVGVGGGGDEDGGAPGLGAVSGMHGTAAEGSGRHMFTLAPAEEMSVAVTVKAGDVKVCCERRLAL